MQLLGGIQLVSIQQLVEGLAQVHTHFVIAGNNILPQIAFSGAVGRIVDLRSERKYGIIQLFPFFHHFI